MDIYNERPDYYKEPSLRYTKHQQEFYEEIKKHV